MFAPARSCIRKRRNDGRLAGARTAADEAFALGALASQLARPTNGLGLLASLLLRRLLIVATELHLAENAFPLHLLLERLESLIDVVVANEYLHACIPVVGRRVDTQRGRNTAPVRLFPSARF